LLALREAGVDFLVLGGLAAVLNGAPVSTFDLDIVHSREPANIARLNLITRRGPLDVLGMIGGNLEYGACFRTRLNWKSEVDCACACSILKLTSLSSRFCAAHWKRSEERRVDAGMKLPIAQECSTVLD